MKLARNMLALCALLLVAVFSGHPAGIVTAKRALVDHSDGTLSLPHRQLQQVRMRIAIVWRVTRCAVLSNSRTATEGFCQVSTTFMTSIIRNLLPGLWPRLQTSPHQLPAMACFSVSPLAI